MGINLNNGFADLKGHVGHDIACVSYGDANVAVECETCGEVLIDFDKVPPGNVRCAVWQHRHGAWTVRFHDHPGRELFLQSDWDQASFAHNAGAISSPDPDNLADFDPETISSCSDEYLSVLTEINLDETDGPPAGWPN